MGYCSIADIVAAVSNDDLVQLTNDNGGDTIATAKITSAIDYVDNMIDGYLRGRYNLPLTSTPDELKFLAIDFVIHRLYSLRTFTPVPQNIEERYTEVKKRLYEIQSGKFSLGIEDTNELSNILLLTNKTSEKSTTNKYFDGDKWEEYDVFEGYN